jgi:excisionase family DNA binding protein
MASQHLVSTKSAPGSRPSARLGPPGAGSVRLVHLCGMDTAAQHPTRSHPSSEHGLDPVVTMSQLAARLGVSVQTFYDLRSQGRGPRGFRVGRELRFRVGEVDAWLARMEADDAARHPTRSGDAHRATPHTDRHSRGDQHPAPGRSRGGRDPGPRSRRASLPSAATSVASCRPTPPLTCSARLADSGRRCPSPWRWCPPTCTP